MVRKVQAGIDFPPGYPYPASRDPSIFLDKAGRSMGLCLEGRPSVAKDTNY